MSAPALSPSALPPPGHPAVPLARLSSATAAVFAVSGFISGSWAARVPDVSAHVDASATALGVALLCIGVGALASMQLTGALCSRLGAGLVTAAAAVLLSAVTVAPALADTVPQLCAALLLFGAAMGTLNVAMNSVGVRVEQRRGRPVLSSLHAAFSLGGLAGALAGGAVGAVVEPAPHLLGVATTTLLVTAAAAPTLLRADTPRPVGPRPERVGASALPAGLAGAVLVLGAIAGCAAFGEGTVTDWGALHLRETLLASPLVASLGYAGFSLAMACGRLGGRALVERYGDTRLLVGGTLLAAAGAVAAALAPTAALAVAGFTLVGLGLSNAFPLAIARAGSLGGPSGVALASTVGYAGQLGGPPAVGFLVEARGLPVGLAVVAPFALLGAGLAATVTPHRRAGVALPAWSWSPALARLEPALVGARSGARRAAADLALLSPRVDVAPGSRRPAYPGLEALAV